MSAANLCAYGVHTLLQSDLLIHSAARGDAARVAKLLRRCEWVNRKTLRARALCICAQTPRKPDQRARALAVCADRRYRAFARS